ncbi:MAG TPA: DUF1592 domain-containing protein [Polyangiaceae bacterium]|nr:DUF1592 domain-containing protein [Polyangiaceae bacterium]
MNRSTLVLIGVCAGLLSSSCAESSANNGSPGGASGAAFGGSSNGAGNGGMAAGAGGVNACLNPPTAPLSLLTRMQYENTVRDLLGDGPSAAADFPPENQVEGFKNNTQANQASPVLVEKYLEAAERLAGSAAQMASALAPCEAGREQVECGRDFVRNFGLRAFRRPLLASETSIFDALFGRVQAQLGYTSAVELTLQAMLQSPQFLYRVDSRGAPSEASGAVALSSYELAARLSYFLTASTPDSQLLEAARAGRLSADEEIEAQARRLLETSRAKEVVREFHHQWLGLDAIAALSPMAPELGEDAALLTKDWLGSLDRFIDTVYWDSGNLQTLFNSKQVFVTPRLAKLYGAPLSGAQPSDSDFQAVTLSDRRGLLTQPALLGLLSHSDQTAPVLRGVFTLKRLMCVAVPNPPPSVNNTPPDPDPNSTTRERFRVHTASTACSGCHRMIDGVGFGFEAYDQLGRYRTEENGIPIDASGTVVIGDSVLDGDFDGVNELADRLETSDRVRDCVATNWYRFAMGRMETEADKCSLDDIKAQFSASGGDLKQLLVSIPKTIAFRYRPAIGGNP